MDDYKRTLYMQALRELLEEKKRRSSLEDYAEKDIYVCLELVTVFRAEHPNKTTTLEFSIKYGGTATTIKEFFPEFMKLYDGTYWNADGLKSTASIGTCWWNPFDLEPRISALECVLRD